MKTVFLRALKAGDKALALRTAINRPTRVNDNQRFEVDAAGFAAMPGTAFVYWISDRLQQIFSQVPPFEADGRTGKQGSSALVRSI